ncbi:penicillin-insensitive murein endopeptidase [Aurantimonas sp. VKM B-3413]|uniref:penicillin-insensitive murein endopeptidase n=1 Tax=Aurantimonas sp. VKM B-3413 TaxID=2779401 RepID=UPI001E3CE56D|nr:penicillin-insensitive murein endopeptidase [Aurantimonas sp. VKM B-3413]MCB8838031.1 penicillin-insensitive murein endopeptidase [Aurantimonas sp. VKM B-3413]
MRLWARLAAASAGAALSAFATAGAASAEQPAKAIFSRQHAAAALPPESVGFYSNGCLAGGAQLPADGPTWQAMRLSRDRRWGMPATVRFIEDLSREAARRGIWPGLLLGDLGQARGGPLPFGHASHQIGLDFDVWLRPMPNPRLTERQREDYPFRSVLKPGTFTVDDRIWNDHYTALIKLAAEEPQVQRIFVNPGIKKKLCDTVSGDRRWMNKVRPYYGHDEHFHVRLFCPPGSADCKEQRSTGTGDGCDQLSWWFNVALKPPPPPKPGAKKPTPKPPLTLSGMPRQCTYVLAAPAKAARPSGAEMIATGTSTRAPAAPGAATAFAPMPQVPIPQPRPLR